MAALDKHGLGLVPVRRMQEPQDIIPMVATNRRRTVEPPRYIVIILGKILATRIEHFFKILLSILREMLTRARAHHQ